MKSGIQIFSTNSPILTELPPLQCSGTVAATVVSSMGNEAARGFPKVRGLFSPCPGHAPAVAMRLLGAVPDKSLVEE